MGGHFVSFFARSCQTPGACPCVLDSGLCSPRGSLQLGKLHDLSTYLGSGPGTHHGVICPCRCIVRSPGSLARHGTVRGHGTVGRRTARSVPGRRCESIGRRGERVTARMNV